MESTEPGAGWSARLYSENDDADGGWPAIPVDTSLAVVIAPHDVLVTSTLLTLVVWAPTGEQSSSPVRSVKISREERNSPDTVGALVETVDPVATSDVRIRSDFRDFGGAAAAHAGRLLPTLRETRVVPADFPPARDLAEPISWSDLPIEIHYVPRISICRICPWWCLVRDDDPGPLHPLNPRV